MSRASLMIPVVLLCALRAEAQSEPAPLPILVDGTSAENTRVVSPLATEPAGPPIDLPGVKIGNTKTEPTPGSPLAGESTPFRDGYCAAVREVDKHGSTGWGLASFGSSCALGPCGMFACVDVAYSRTPAVPPAPAVDGRRAAEYEEGWQHGYETQLKKRRAKAAYRGGAISLGIAGAYVLLLLVAASR